jgi:hypothetical protein
MAAPLSLILLWPTNALPACASNKPINRKEFILFVAVALTFVLLTLLAIDWRTFFQWVFAANVEIAQNDTILAANWHWISTTLTSIWPLLWLAIVGSLVLYTTPKRYNLLIILTWFLATIAIFLVWSPLWEHYRLFLTFPLILAAGGGLATLSEWLITREVSRQRPYFLILTGFALIGLILFGLNRWQATQPYLVTGDREWTADHLAARAFLSSQTSANAFVTTDDPLLAFAADRFVPPALTEATLKMINTGFFTLGDAIESTLDYQAETVLFATGRLERLSGFEEWVTAVAHQRHDFGAIRAYTLPPI